MYTQTLQELELGQTGYSDRGLCPFGGSKCVCIGRAALVTKTRNWKDHFVQGGIGVEGKVCCVVPGGAGRVEVHGQCASHSYILTALPGEDKGDLSLCNTDAVGGAIRIGERGFRSALNSLEGFGETLNEFGFSACHKCQATGMLGAHFLRTFPGNALKHSRVLCPLKERLDLCDKLLAALGREGHQFLGECS